MKKHKGLRTEMNRNPLKNTGRCRDCGRFISYHAITKDHDGCFECNPNATYERHAEIRRCIA